MKRWIRWIILLPLILQNSYAQKIDFTNPDALLLQAENYAAHAKITESRRLIMAWLVGMPFKTFCGKSSVFSNNITVDYFFPVNKSLEFAILRKGILQFFKIERGKVKIVWQAILIENASQDTNYANTVIGFTKKDLSNAKFVNKCGVMPKDKGAYAFFETQEPPGLLDFGVVNYKLQIKLAGSKYLEELPYNLPMVDLP